MIGYQCDLRYTASFAGKDLGSCLKIVNERWGSKRFIRMKTDWMFPVKLSYCTQLKTMVTTQKPNTMKESTRFGMACEYQSAWCFEETGAKVAGKITCVRKAWHRLSKGPFDWEPLCRTVQAFEVIPRRITPAQYPIMPHP